MNFINPVSDVGVDQYEAVAASATAVLGPNGAKGDFVLGLLVVPTSLSPQAISVLDGATSITVFAGGANSIGSLQPFYIPLGWTSVSGAWSVTTGSGLSVVAGGRFT